MKAILVIILGCGRAHLHPVDPDAIDVEAHVSKDRVFATVHPVVVLTEDCASQWLLPESSHARLWILLNQYELESV